MQYMGKSVENPQGIYRKGLAVPSAQKRDSAGELGMAAVPGCIFGFVLPDCSGKIINGRRPIVSAGDEQCVSM